MFIKGVCLSIYVVWLYVFVLYIGVCTAVCCCVCMAVYLINLYVYVANWSTEDRAYIMLSAEREGKIKKIVL